jgi:putative efflux protein, MATE family
MKTSYIADMTKGSETRHLVKFAVPMLIGNIFQQFYNIINTIVVGKYVGEEALAGVGSVGSLSFLFFSLCVGLALGVGIIVAHSFGAGNEAQIKKTIGNSIYLIGGIGILMSILGVVLAEPILTFMAVPEETMPYALVYMKILCGGTIWVAGYNGISAILRSLGDTKTPLIFLIISNILNVVLVMLFVLQFNMGVVGVAWATVISQAFAMIGSILFALKVNPYLKLEKEYLKLDKVIFKQCMKIGIPIGLQNSLIAVSLVALQGVVNSFGTVVMVAFTTTGRIEQIIQQPFSSIGAAMSTFAGQNLGVGNVDRVKRAFKKAMMLVIVFSLCSLIVFIFAGEWIMGCFVDNPEAIAMGANALRITGVFYIALGTIYVTRGILNGAGDGVFAFINGVVEVFGRIVFSLILVRIPMIGAWGLWGTTGLTWFITGITGMLRYLKGTWKNIEL